MQNDRVRERYHGARSSSVTKTIAVLNCDSTLNRMKAIADMAFRVKDAPDLKLKFLTAAGDLDSLWDTFIRHNEAVLNALLDLDLASEYSITLETEVRTLYFDARAILEAFAPLSTNRALSQGSSHKPFHPFRSPFTTLSVPRNPTAVLQWRVVWLAGVPRLLYGSSRAG